MGKYIDSIPQRRHNRCLQLNLSRCLGTTVAARIAQMSYLLADRLDNQRNPV